MFNVYAIGLGGKFHKEDLNCMPPIQHLELSIIDTAPFCQRFLKTFYLLNYQRKTLIKRFFARKAYM